MYPLAGITSDQFIRVIGLGILPLYPRMHVEACDWAAEGNTSHALFDGRTMREALIYDKFGVANAYARCPLWVKSRHLQRKKRCPLYPQKRTCAVHKLMSAKCHYRTHALQQTEPLICHLFSEREGDVAVDARCHRAAVPHDEANQDRSIDRSPRPLRRLPDG